jgi:hypothetical protein
LPLISSNNFASWGTGPTRPNARQAWATCWEFPCSCCPLLWARIALAPAEVAGRFLARRDATALTSRPQPTRHGCRSCRPVETNGVLGRVRYSSHFTMAQEPELSLKRANGGRVCIRDALAKDGRFGPVRRIVLRHFSEDSKFVQLSSLC